MPSDEHLRDDHLNLGYAPGGADRETEALSVAPGDFVGTELDVRRSIAIGLKQTHGPHELFRTDFDRYRFTRREPPHHKTGFLDAVAMLCSGSGLLRLSNRALDGLRAKASFSRDGSELIDANRPCVVGPLDLSGTLEDPIGLDLREEGQVSHSLSIEVGCRSRVVAIYLRPTFTRGEVERKWVAGLPKTLNPTGFIQRRDGVHRALERQWT
jgi:hypothetical protein